MKQSGHYTVRPEDFNLEESMIRNRRYIEVDKSHVQFVIMTKVLMGISLTETALSLPSPQKIDQRADTF